MNHTKGFSELTLLQHIASASARPRWPHVLVGPGDDCAVLAQPISQSPSHPHALSNIQTPRLLLKVDQLLEGKHFTSCAPLHLVARKAVARVVSDLAAMGGVPVAFLAACTLPADVSQADATRLADAVHAWCEHWGAPCVGGDIATCAVGSALALSISALGVSERPLLRTTALPGDVVCITGAVGGSFVPHASAKDLFAGGGKHLHFSPRLQEALWLQQACGEHLHAMIDVSDGLGIDAGRLARASGVSIELDAHAVPLHDASRSVRDAIADGEDYELLFTCSNQPPSTCPITGTHITPIGRVLAPTPQQPAGSVVLMHGSTLERVEDAGYQHEVRSSRVGSPHER